MRSEWVLPVKHDNEVARVPKSESAVTCFYHGNHRKINAVSVRSAVLKIIRMSQIFPLKNSTHTVQRADCTQIVHYAH